jgi:hypothetical protein
MLSAVIGNGGGDSDHRRWGWYVFENEDYRSLSEQEIRARIQIDPASECEVWTADASAVQAVRT